jgi:hypothetical protein
MFTNYSSSSTRRYTANQSLRVLPSLVFHTIFSFNCTFIITYCSWITAFHLIQFPPHLLFYICMHNLMFVPCIVRCSRNNQHNAQICTTALFYMLAPTCFGSSLSSSPSFWIRLSYVKIQVDMVVYHIMLVKWTVCRSVVVQCVVLPSRVHTYI